jgi:hypothetical protein
MLCPCTFRVLPEISASKLMDWPMKDTDAVTLLPFALHFPVIVPTMEWVATAWPFGPSSIVTGP